MYKVQNGGILIGDFHNGALALPPAQLEMEFDNCVMPYLEQNADKIKFVIQLGDYIDRRLSLDSEDSKTAIRILHKLLAFCQPRGIVVRMIKGGIAHDYSQLQNYLPLERTYPVFKLILTTQHEELLPGFDVLWMPEEYPSDYDAFYNPFFFDEEGDFVYDAIFGHGEIDVAAGWSRMNEGERQYGGTPCHSAERLLKHCSGLIEFGHVHGRFSYKGRLKYTGSFSRWVHGDESDKGISHVTLSKVDEDAPTWDIEHLFVQNVNARSFTTKKAAELFVVGDPVDTIVKNILDEAEKHHSLRVDLRGFSIGLEEMTVIRGALAGKPLISLISPVAAFQATSEEQGTLTEGESPENQDTANEERLSYLRDPRLPGEERLMRYMHETDPSSQSIDLDTIRELTSPLQA